MEIIVNESQFKLLNESLDREEQIRFISERWETLSEGEKIFISELLKNLSINEKINLNEGWWNTVMDVVGIVDPTGVVDLVNGLDYIRQGDYFFGLLSMIAVIPYVGDAIAKPIMAFSKSSQLMKSTNAAMKTVKETGKTAEAAKTLQKASKSSPLFGKLSKSASKWGPKLKSAIDMVPGGRLTSGLKKTLNDWIDLFINVGRNQKMAGKITANFAKKVAKSDPKTAQKLLKQLKGELKNQGKVFRNFKATDPSWAAKNIWPGLSGKLYRNKDLTSLLIRTKFYAGFLDYLGVANFVGPDELVNKMGKESFDESFGQYTKLPTSKEYWKEDMGVLSSVDGQNKQFRSQSPQTRDGFSPPREPVNQSNFMDSLFGELFGGI